MIVKATTGTCSVGYNGTYPNCVEVNLCLINHGGCDLHVTCSSTLGNVTCGSCPTGYSGDGYSQCYALCGNHTCDSALGETCVSCPIDCHSTTCEQCGDGVCDPNESCNNCYEDCKASCLPSCPQCSTHGVCTNGICVCMDGWTGPTCSAPKVPINVTIDDTKPQVELNTGAISFGISIKSLTEIDRDEQIISSISLDSSITFNRSDSNLIGSSSNLVWEYSTTLSNQAIFIHFKEASTMQLFGEETQFDANTLKFNFKVSNWPFKSISNSLQVGIENSISSDACDDKNEVEGHLQWLRFSFNEFNPNAMIDDRKRNIKFSAINTTMVAATVPHFWSSAELDPNYSVLLYDKDNEEDENNACSASSSNEQKDKEKKTLRLVLSIVIPVIVGIGILVAVGIVVYPKLRTRYQVNKKNKGGHAELNNMSSSSDSTLPPANKRL